MPHPSECYFGLFKDIDTENKIWLRVLIFLKMKTLSLSRLWDMSWNSSGISGWSSGVDFSIIWWYPVPPGSGFSMGAGCGGEAF